MYPLISPVVFFQAANPHRLQRLNSLLACRQSLDLSRHLAKLCQREELRSRESRELPRNRRRTRTRPWPQGSNLSGVLRPEMI